MLYCDQMVTKDEQTPAVMMDDGTRLAARRDIPKKGNAR
jgi:hypothetical protein